jgi:hypothetical protein
MTPLELASRLAAMDWSGCSLQHRLAVACAVETLEGLGGSGGEVVAFEVPMFLHQKLEHAQQHKLVAPGPSETGTLQGGETILKINVDSPH